MDENMKRGMLEKTEISTCGYLPLSIPLLATTGVDFY
jgi:hypothetical protein